MLTCGEASEHSKRATRPACAGEAARKGACRGVRGAKPLGKSIVEHFMMTAGQVF
jgi:hypothetical protein